MEPFETGYIDAGIQASQVNVWRLNSNALYYVSPVVAGFKAGLQYSFTAKPTRKPTSFRTTAPSSTPRFAGTAPTPVRFSDLKPNASAQPPRTKCAATTPST